MQNANKAWWRDVTIYHSKDVPWRMKCRRVEQVYRVFWFDSEKWSWSRATLDRIKGLETKKLEPKTCSGLGLGGGRGTPRDCGGEETESVRARMFQTSGRALNNCVLCVLKTWKQDPFKFHVCWVFIHVHRPRAPKLFKITSWWFKMSQFFCLCCAKGHFKKHDSFQMGTI